MKKNLLFSFLFSLFVFQIHASDEAAAQIQRLRTKAKEAKKYCAKNSYNTSFCVLVDMNIHSGKKRAYLWSFSKDTIVEAGMCSHGCGKSPWGETSTKNSPVFSNVPDSHCSSLGKYKIGKRGYSSWGIHVNYKLYGLETTNSNAYKREIVLHSWEDVPASEVFPFGIPEGWGCPAVSNIFMKALDAKLKEASTPVLLWIFKE